MKIIENKEVFRKSMWGFFALGVLNAIKVRLAYTMPSNYDTTDFYVSKIFMPFFSQLIGLPILVFLIAAICSSMIPIKKYKELTSKDKFWSWYGEISYILIGLGVMANLYYIIKSI